MKKIIFISVFSLLAAIVVSCGGDNTASACNAKHGEKRNQCKVQSDTCPAQKVCIKCGEIKGSDTCCKSEGREKCTKCGLFKGSVGCCQIPKGAEEVFYCKKCSKVVTADEMKKMCKEKCENCEKDHCKRAGNKTKS